MTKKRKATGEKKMFFEIWEEREHICENCLIHLGSEPIVHYFSHIKSKGAYPELRLDKNNIQLLCMDCHYAYDFQGKDKFNKRKRNGGMG
jgi:5-methylcytosine-specific restriction endonuclease McrA